MIPRISNLEDIRDFIILLYIDEEKNKKFLLKTNYIETIGRGYLENRKSIVEYFSIRNRSKKWDPNVFEKHIFNALNMLGISFNYQNKWYVNKRLLKEINELNDGLGSKLNNNEVDFFRKLLFDVRFRKKLLPKINIEYDYTSRWFNIFSNIFIEQNHFLQNKLLENNLIKKYFEKRVIQIITLSTIENIIDENISKLNSNNTESAKREASTFISWNKQLAIIDEIPKLIAFKCLNIEDRLFFVVNEEISFKIFVKSFNDVYSYLLLRDETVSLIKMKCYLMILLSISNDIYDNLFKRIRDNNRSNIIISPTSPAYFEKNEWRIIRKWIYKEKKVNYLTIRLIGEIGND